MLSRRKNQRRTKGGYWRWLGIVAVSPRFNWDVRTELAIKLVRHVVQRPEDLELLRANVPRMTMANGRSKRFDPFDFLDDVIGRPLIRESIRSKAAAALRRYKRPQQRGFWGTLRTIVAH
jgi:hypothetical protein